MEVGRRQLLILALLCEGGMALTAVAIAWWLALPYEDALWPTVELMVQGCVAALPLTVLFLALYHFPVGPMAEIRRLCDVAIGPLFRPCTVADLAFVSLLAGIGEEFLFRGVLQTILTSKLGAPWGLVLASVAFGLLHAITPGYVVLATGFGIYLGWLYQMTGSLIPPIIAHALYDFLVLWYLHRIETVAPPPPPLETAADETIATSAEPPESHPEAS